MTGCGKWVRKSTHPHITSDDVANLSVPILSPDVQANIASEIVRRRDETQGRRVEAEAGWEGAKRGVEGELLCG